jgi:hypothetical protein
MPRRARLALAGVSTHLVQRGIDRGACFFRDDDRLHYLALLAELAPALHHRGRSPDYKLSRGVIRAASRVAGGVFR